MDGDVCHRSGGVACVAAQGWPLGCHGREEGSSGHGGEALQLSREWLERGLGVSKVVAGVWVAVVWWCRWCSSVDCCHDQIW